jgi:hypothetical protein
VLVRFIPLATVSLMTLSGLTASLSGPADAPRDDAPPAAAADLKPVTVAVVDRGSNAPATAFTAYFRYDAPVRVSPENENWTPVESPSGTFETQAPPDCLSS